MRGNSMAQANQRRDRRALLGDNFQRQGGNFEQTDDLLERQNDDHTEILGAKIKQLKSLTIDIGTAVRDQNNMLDGMETDFSKAGGLLGSTMQRLTAFSKTPHGMQMCYLIVFVVFVFFVAYFAISGRSSSSSAAAVAPTTVAQ